MDTLINDPSKDFLIETHMLGADGAYNGLQLESAGWLETLILPFFFTTLLLEEKSEPLFEGPSQLILGYKLTRTSKTVTPKFIQPLPSSPPPPPPLPLISEIKIPLVQKKPKSHH